MSGIATAIVGTAALGAIVSTNNTNKAVSAQENAANSADQTQWNMFQQNEQDMAPWRQAGQQALGQLQGLESTGFNYDKYSDPGLAFQMQQGQDAISRATANRGGMLAGSTLGALDQYSQGLGNSAYQSAFGRYQAQIGNLQSMAGLGANAASQTASLGANTANNVSGNLMNVGQGQAGAYLANSNMWTGTLNNAGNQWMNYSMMNKMFPGAGVGGGMGSYTDGTMGNMGASQYWNTPGNTYTGYNGQPVDVTA
jgi:hypothetical protein